MSTHNVGFCAKIRPNTKIFVFSVTCLKKIGRVSWDFFM